MATFIVFFCSNLVLLVIIFLDILMNFHYFRKKIPQYFFWYLENPINYSTIIRHWGFLKQEIYFAFL